MPKVDNQLPEELPKDRKEAYELLNKVTDGRKEGDIPIGDQYWKLIGDIRRAESTGYFDKPKVPKPEPTTKL